MSGRPILAPLLLALAALGAPGCREAPEARPDVLLITVDTLRPDHLGTYGDEHVRTPNIDRLAAQGAVFEDAVTDTPWTTPSVSSVMTGTYATIHGFKSTATNRLAPENVTLAEVLRGAGYATAAVVGSFPLDSVFQLDQGFDHYDDDFTTPIWVMPGHKFEHVESEFFDSPDRQRFFILSKALNDSRREDAEVTEAALKWLREERVEPFFLWVHYFGPHEKPDWTVAEERRESRRIGMYDPDTEVADRAVGRLLEAVDALGLADKTFVVFHSDHGESLGEHGLVGHGQLLNDASMRIPLILRYPGRIAPGVRVSQLVRNVDIFPTVLDVVGVASDRKLSGESLLPLVGSAAERGWTALREHFSGERAAYMETYYPAHVAFATPVTLPDGTKLKVGLIRRGVRTREWEYVKTEPYPLIDVAPGSLPQVPDELKASLVGEELYHLTAPSGENLNVIRKYPEVVEQMRGLFERYVKAERGFTPSVPADRDPEMQLRLKSLGYGE